MYIRKPCGASNNNNRFTRFISQELQKVHQSSQNKKFISVYPVLEVFVPSVHNSLSGYCVCSLLLLSSSLLIVRVFFVLESVYSSCCPTPKMFGVEMWYFSTNSILNELSALAGELMRSEGRNRSKGSLICRIYPELDVIISGNELDQGTYQESGS
jgi:hypothetical protein